MKFTVLVITYNSKWDKLELTLSSVLNQTMDEYEIVIADDGSKNNLRSEIEAYFKKRGFSNYKLVMNPENQGTVGNIITGLEVAVGRYVKFISAGDLLFNQDTLQLIYEFMSEKKSESCFGLLQAYRVSEGKIEKVAFTHPFDIESYRKNNRKRIMKNLVLFSDNVCGAAISYELNFAKEYMCKIHEQVRFEEDIFQVLAAVEGRGMDFFDEYVVWYELGTGISTKKKSDFEKMLEEDVDKFYRALYEKYPTVACVKKRYQILGLYKIKNIYGRTILRFLINPYAIVYVSSYLVQRLRGCHCKGTDLVGFLEGENYK